MSGMVMYVSCSLPPLMAETAHNAGNFLCGRARAKGVPHW